MKKMPYQGVATFLGTPMGGSKSNFDFREAPIGFLGLPYDCSTTFRPGARMGPNAIRQSSLMLTDGEHPVFEVDPALHIVDCGDAAITHVGQEQALIDMQSAIRQHIIEPQRHPLFAGGDHLVSLAAVRELSKKHGNLSLIHFDAHCDTWPDHFGDRIGHGTWVRNAIEEGCVDPFRTLQIGIRSPVDRETKQWLPRLGGTVCPAEECLRPILTEIGERQHSVLELIRKFSRLKNVYISFDIDALDPAHAPGTGTPEIGGLTSAFALRCLSWLHTENLVGMDVVEVLPAYDHSEITSLAAATFLWTYAANLIANKSRP